ncbi:single-stranded DNA-binding protein, mitochondrial-like [Liolophura sinensis]|uniref:single-stranded DNA-binding protein, mitochondrial-like n=1 Tax=Liolophura sinensis TaxID=3198878 RepID=UPI0031582D0B
MLRIFARRVGRLAKQSTRAFNEGQIEVEEETKRYEKCINQVNILGRVGRDAEIRGSEIHPVVVFSVATNNFYTKADGTNVSRVDWHRISVFRPGLREKIAANIKKGDRVFVNGRIQYDDYRDRETATRTANIVADDIVNLTKRYLRMEDE